MGACWRAAANWGGAGALLALALVLSPYGSSAAPPSHARVFDRAEFLLSDTYTPPGDADDGYVEVGSFGPLSVTIGGDLSLTGGSGQYAWARILRARP
ncbi:MAG TPA: hypothetical protein VKP89_14760 [Burkholderiales bacterium]|nr:hypothetical protein [Burkholderiales bacterium]